MTLATAVESLSCTYNPTTQAYLKRKPTPSAILHSANEATVSTEEREKLIKFLHRRRRRLHSKIANQQNIDFQNVLTTHDQVKRLTDLLLFYANGSKDTTMGR
jgi:hypothetical protein